MNIEREFPETVASIKLDSAIDHCISLIGDHEFEETYGVSDAKAIWAIVEAVGGTVRRRDRKPFTKALREVKALAERVKSKPGGSLQTDWQIQALESEAAEALEDEKS